MNIKVFSIMSTINETRHVSCHKTCACKFCLDVSICNDKQSWNNDKCRCECKELIQKVDVMMGLFGILVYVNVNVIVKCNCKCRKRLIGKLLLECENEILNTTDTISITDKKVTCKNNYLNYIILLLNICLILLAIVSISCY